MAIYALFMKGQAGDYRYYSFYEHKSPRACKAAFRAERGDKPHYIIRLTLDKLYSLIESDFIQPKDWAFLPSFGGQEIPWPLALSYDKTRRIILNKGKPSLTIR